MTQHRTNIEYLLEEIESGVRFLLEENSRLRLEVLHLSSQQTDDRKINHLEQEIRKLTEIVNEFRDKEINNREKIAHIRKIVQEEISQKNNQEMFGPKISTHDMGNPEAYDESGEVGYSPYIGVDEEMEIANSSKPNRPQRDLTANYTNQPNRSETNSTGIQQPNPTEVKRSTNQETSILPIDASDTLDANITKEVPREPTLLESSGDQADAPALSDFSSLGKQESPSNPVIPEPTPQPSHINQTGNNDTSSDTIKSPTPVYTSTITDYPTSEQLPPKDQKESFIVNSFEDDDDPFGNESDKLDDDEFFKKDIGKS